MVASGFNQIERGWVKKYKELWNIPDEITELLEHFVGQKVPKSKDCKDDRRMFLTEFSEVEQVQISVQFTEQKELT